MARYIRSRCSGCNLSMRCLPTPGMMSFRVFDQYFGAGETGAERTTSVSRYHSGVSPYGVYDMVGNVWEWLATPTAPGRYELRGSAFTSPLFRGVPAVPNDADDTMHDDDTGFRCVASPEQIGLGEQ
ncbi:SUMF1/EgtB/PvdO family nonheme iron enzyme [Streptomyces sp. NPDC048845]|uniref:SUMF1/EgtB/PvdO family nonheme iron enzyme n=1 Tax=Streptomyces sp. NPDC048845 TaxID=3155390 RepID=UPI00342416E3